nr:uncharacterized protein LOC115139441 isoform X1 [Oncorhynchus nerka]
MPLPQAATSLSLPSLSPLHSPPICFSSHKQGDVVQSAAREPPRLLLLDPQPFCQPPHQTVCDLQINIHLSTHPTGAAPPDPWAPGPLLSPPSVTSPPPLSILCTTPVHLS